MSFIFPQIDDTNIIKPRESTMNLSSALHSELFVFTIPKFEWQELLILVNFSPFIILHMFIVLNPMSVNIFTHAKYLIRFFSVMKLNQQHSFCTRITQFIDSNRGLYLPECLMDF